MSTSDALHEYAELHQEDISVVERKLHHRRVDPKEIDRVMKLLSLDSSAMVYGEGFTVSRDIDNHFTVQFDNDIEQAA